MIKHKKAFVTDQISIVVGIHNLIAMVPPHFSLPPPPLKRISTSQPHLDPSATSATKDVREEFTFLSPEPTSGNRRLKWLPYFFRTDFCMLIRVEWKL